MLEVNKLKEQFIKNEILTSSIIGAFGRNKIYKNGINDKQRNLLKQYIRERLPKYENFYKHKKSSSDHIREIVRIKIEFSKKFKYILNGNEITIGTVQKLLNLYLKYLWVLNYIPEPPHCPIDGIVIQELEKVANKNLPNWPKMGRKDYQECIDIINKIKEYKSVATWELNFWNN